MKRLLFVLISFLALSGLAGAASTAPDVPTAITDLTTTLNWFHSTQKTGGRGYSIARTQKTKAYKAMVALGGVWPAESPPPVTTTTTTTTTPTNTSSCFSALGACGYPDPNYGNVGTPAGTNLTPSGSITVNTPGATVNALDVNGSITVNAPNVTISNTRVTASGGGGSSAINVTASATGLTIKDSTVRGAGTSSPQSIESAVFNGYHVPITITRDYFYNCADCLEYGPATVTDSYMIVNGLYSGAHYEDIYLSDDALTVTHSVLLNPQMQTATVFGDTHLGGGGACSNQITIKNSLLAGGGFTLYSCGNASSVGTSILDFENNRFARCGTPSVQNGDGTVCSGGSDTSGYYPNSGYFGRGAYVYCPNVSKQVWSGNVWDDTGAIADC